MKGLICAQRYQPPEVLVGKSSCSAISVYSTHLRAGLQWSYGVDTYAVGCVIAELCLLSNLFPPEIASIREHLAIIERALGRFPLEFASVVEKHRPGTFLISTTSTSVIFPATDVTTGGAEYTAAI